MPAMTFYAYAWRSGHIEIGPQTPAGALTIARHKNPETLKRAITPLARRAYHGRVLLVPGVPEAEPDTDAAVRALAVFTARVAAALKTAGD